MHPAARQLFNQFTIFTFGRKVPDVTCLTCGSNIGPYSFTSDASKAEYLHCGMCQQCQNDTSQGDEIVDLELGGPFS